MRSIANLLDRIPGRLVWWLMVLLVLYFGVTTAEFLQPKNALNITQQAAPLFILALGATFVILCNGLDLSSGAVLSLAGIAMAMGSEAGLAWPACIAVGLLVGVVCGWLNGVGVAYGRMPAFIVTFGMMGVAQGVALILTGGNSIAVMSPELQFLGVGTLFGLPFLLVASLVLFAALSFLLYRTAFGNHLFAVGGNEEGALLSGVPVTRTLIAVYTLSGLLAAVAGLLLAGWMYSGQPAVGIGMEFEAIAAVVLGGTALAGGRGSLVNTIIGVAIITVLRNGLAIALVPNNWHTAIVGLFIVVVIAADTLVAQLRSQARLSRLS